MGVLPRYVGELVPAMTAQMAMTRMASREWSLRRLIRGPKGAKVAKQGKGLGHAGPP
jgi:hypothetical protein